MRHKKAIVCAIAAMLISVLNAVTVFSDEPSANTAVQPEYQIAIDSLAPSEFTEEDIAAYRRRIFELVNQEREKAGLKPLKQSETLDKAANIRALECASVESIRVDGKPHTRPDGSRWFTVLGVEKNYHYGENTGQGGYTAEMRMAGWMNNDGHKSNILREDYTEIGIGCAVSDQGTIFAIQIFYRP